MRVERFEDLHGVPMDYASALYASIFLREVPRRDERRAPLVPPALPFYRDPDTGLWKPLSLAIAFNSKTGGGAFDSAGTISWSHNATGDDFIWAHVTSHNSSANTLSAGIFDPGGSSGGVTLTKLIASDYVGAQIGTPHNVWYGVVPAGNRGTHNIQFTNSGGNYWLYESVSWSGVHQTTPIGAHVDGHEVIQASGTFTEAITTANAGSIIGIGCNNQENADFSSGSNTTLRKQVGGNFGAGTLEMTAASAGAFAPNINVGGGSYQSSILVEIRAAAGGGGGGNNAAAAYYYRMMNGMMDKAVH